MFVVAADLQNKLQDEPSRIKNKLYNLQQHSFGVLNPIHSSHTHPGVLFLFEAMNGNQIHLLLITAATLLLSIVVAVTVIGTPFARREMCRKWRWTGLSTYCTIDWKVTMVSKLIITTHFF